MGNEDRVVPRDIFLHAPTLLGEHHALGGVENTEAAVRYFAKAGQIFNGRLVRTADLDMRAWPMVKSTAALAHCLRQR